MSKTRTLKELVQKANDTKVNLLNSSNITSTLFSSSFGGFSTGIAKTTTRGRGRGRRGRMFVLICLVCSLKLFVITFIIYFSAKLEGKISPVDDSKVEIEPRSKRLKIESEEKTNIDMSDARRLVKKAIARNKLSS